MQESTQWLEDGGGRFRLQAKSPVKLLSQGQKLPFLANFIDFLKKSVATQSAFLGIFSGLELMAGCVKTYYF